mmetsp:Transcript_9341/g.17929  ORF Transcript_9341/g.17929 Transcript_9341/m.17929 type:complete len:332 (-) Transcript_9341:880-1875(-)
MLSKVLQRQFSAALESSFHKQLAKFQYREALKTEGAPVRWIYRELERYAGAYTLGLAELGLSNKDLLVLWLGRKDATEAFILQFGALHAGVPFHLVGNEDLLSSALIRAKGLVFSPWESCQGEARADYVLTLLPELRQTQHGSLLKAAQFPNLQHVIQTGHSTIRGTIKLKQLPVYADFSQTSIPRPNPSAETLAFEHDNKGSLVSVTQGQLYERVAKLNSALALKKEDVVVNTLDPNSPGFLASSLTPLVVGSRSVISGVTNTKKTFASQLGTVLAYDGTADFKDQSVKSLLLSAANAADAEQLAKHAKDVAKIEAQKVVVINSSTLELI